MSMFGTVNGTAFQVWCPDRGQEKGDGMLIRSHSAESAAVKWAERDDAQSADYSIASGNDATVLVSEARRVRADAMEHARACMDACGGWTVETLGHNIESAFGDELDADQCDDIAREALRRWK